MKGQPVARKFYSKDFNEGINEDTVKTFQKKLVVLGPTEQYKTPITENQRSVFSEEFIL